MNILDSAYRAWCSAAPLRERRQRYKKYTYGDQWCDIIADEKARPVVEEQNIIDNGGRPLKNNLIRQLVKTIVGRYRTQAAEAGLYQSDDIAAIASANCLAELDARLLEEFLISGCVVQRIVSERRWDGTGVWVDNVSLPRFFVNAFRDPRGTDIDLAGMLHDMSLPEIINRFAHGSMERADEIRRIYGHSGADSIIAPDTAGMGSDSDDFFVSSAPGRHRVIEVWTLDSSADADNAAVMDFRWHCRYFAPDGTVLDEFDSPYAHRSHPFVLRFYPLTDGEVHSFVEDVIDQQRHINRLIVMLDRMLATSAKGVLLYPVDQLVKNFSWDDITRTWARSDGVIPVKGGTSPLPQQVVTNPSGSGAYRLLELQMKLFEDISGVGDALLGRTGGTARGVEMFDTQVRNATIALADIFDTFTTFTETRNRKALATVPAVP